MKYIISLLMIGLTFGAAQADEAVIKKLKSGERLVTNGEPSAQDVDPDAIYSYRDKKGTLVITNIRTPGAKVTKIDKSVPAVADIKESNPAK